LTRTGNISDAKDALTAQQKDISSHNGGQSNDPFSQDLQTLSDALQSGKRSDAQSIFAGIQDKPAATESLSTSPLFRQQHWSLSLHV